MISIVRFPASERNVRSKPMSRTVSESLVAIAGSSPAAQRSNGIRSLPSVCQPRSCTNRTTRSRGSVRRGQVTASRFEQGMLFFGCESRQLAASQRCERTQFARRSLRTKINQRVELRRSERTSRRYFFEDLKWRRILNRQINPLCGIDAPIDENRRVRVLFQAPNSVS